MLISESVPGMVMRCKRKKIVSAGVHGNTSLAGQRQEPE